MKICLHLIKEDHNTRQPQKEAFALYTRYGLCQILRAYVTRVSPRGFAPEVIRANLIYMPNFLAERRSFNFLPFYFQFFFLVNSDLEEPCLKMSLSTLLRAVQRNLEIIFFSILNKKKQSNKSITLILLPLPRILPLPHLFVLDRFPPYYLVPGFGCYQFSDSRI